MMAKTPKQEAIRYDDESRLVDLIKTIPKDVFVGMVSRSGMPAVEARELCERFKRLVR